MPFTVSDDERADLLCTYAALILYEEGGEISPENIKTLIEAAGGDVEEYYPKLFASVLAGKDLNSVLFGASASGSSGSSSSGSSSSGSSSSDSSSDSDSD